MTAGRHLSQPLGVFQLSVSNTASLVVRWCLKIASRTTLCECSVQAHTGLSLALTAWYAPPTVDARICSTRPVQDPQDDAALVCFLTSSSVNSPFSLIALTMVPLHTPLQPHTSAVSGMLAARFSPLWPASPSLFWPNIRWSRISATLWRSFINWKYHEPSAVSPYSTEPTMRSSLSTTRLYTPPWRSCSTMSSVPGPPLKSPAEKTSMPVTLSLVEVTEPS